LLLFRHSTYRGAIHVYRKLLAPQDCMLAVSQSFRYLCEMWFGISAHQKLPLEADLKLLGPV
jgi:hypothetical protein